MSEMQEERRHKSWLTPSDSAVKPIDVKIDVGPFVFILLKRAAYGV